MTKRLPWQQTYYNIKSRCNNPNEQNYKYYGARGIKCLISVEELKILYIRDNAKNMKESSIDRIDNDGNYIFENCRYVEKGQNSAERNRRVLSIPVLQFDLEGNFIREWNDIKKIAKIFKCHISSIYYVLERKHKSSGGFIWRYKE